jgi:NAD(P)-dependent dehydrogenase (short-subunit alcohol dehydrogenase family)
MAEATGRLKDKVAVITAAASGMGAATARLFAREGASVLLADIDEALGQQVAGEIVRDGGTASFLRADVTREQDIVAMIETAVERYGRLDILYNNAGGGVGGSDEGPTALERLTAAEWDHCHALNLRSVFLGIKYALPHLRRAGGGSIIATGSDAGLRGIKGTYAYNAMKAGLHMLVQSFAQTAGPENIRVNAIAPGFTATAMLMASLPADADRTILPLAQPLPRAGRPEDIARAALFLASDEGSFVTGVVLPVDGGWLAQGDQNSRFTLHMHGAEKPAWG